MLKRLGSTSGGGTSIGIGDDAGAASTAGAGRGAREAMLPLRLRLRLRLRLLRLRLGLGLGLRLRIPVLQEVGIRVGGERREHSGAETARQASTRARLLLEHTSGHHASEPRRLSWLLDHRRPQPAGQGAPAALPVTQPASGALLLGANQVEHREARNEASAAPPFPPATGACRSRAPSTVSCERAGALRCR